MKTNKLKLDKIELLDSSIQVAHMTLEIKLTGYCKTVKFSSNGNYKLRLDSSLTTTEIRQLMEWLKERDENDINNETKIISYAEQMIKANQKLKTIKQL